MAIAKTSLSDQQRQAILDSLLVRYTQNLSLEAAFSQVGSMSRSTYQRLLRQYPNAVQAADTEAREIVHKQLRSEQLAFTTAQMAHSRAIQDRAAELIKEGLPLLGQIVRGEVRTIQVGDEEKRIVAYPRDSLKAMEMLQSLARGGTLPEGNLPFQQQAVQEDKTPTAMLPPLLGGGTSFTKVTAETANGQVFTASVNTEDDVIEGEVVEGEIERAR